ncbi:MAG: biopolymer transporter ExbD [Treponema sp.]|nr:biopolymer transporter ExbD [Treponema sp.]
MIKRFLKHDVDDSSSSGALNDLSFLLIIFFIVIAGFNVNKGFLLNLPSKEKPRIVKTEDLMKCHLKADGTLILEGKTVSLLELSSKIEEKKSVFPNMTFLLLIDSNTEYQHVIDIIYEVKQKKIENFSFKMIENSQVSAV